MTEVGTAYVRVRPHVAGFRRELETGVSGATAGIGKAMGVVAAAGAITQVLRVAFNEMKESAYIHAQTEAVIRSTGGAAKVTAKEVDDLAWSLGHMSGADDEVVQSGANLLLTFTKIRNEVGAGNDVFNQATAAVLDMSTAMGRDLKGTALTVGKALQDPGRGIVALRRAGVAFNETQVQMIKNWVDTGKILTAQKYILAELAVEFGGSAEAAGKTLPGQLAIMRESIVKALGVIATGLTPALIAVGDSFFEIAGMIGVVADALGPLLAPIGELIGYLNSGGVAADFLQGALGGIVTAFIAYKIAAYSAAAAQAVYNAVTNAHPLGLLALAIAGLVAGLITLYRHNEAFAASVDSTWADIRRDVETAVADIQAFWREWGDEITAITRTVMGYVKSYIESALRVIRGIFQVVGGLLRGDWSLVWEGIKNILGGQLDAMKALLGAQLAVWRAAAGALGNALVDGAVLGIGGLVNVIVEGLDAAWEGAKASLDRAYEFGRDMAGELARGFVESIPGSGAGAAIGDFLYDAYSKVGSTGAEVSYGYGARMGEALPQGMMTALAASSPGLARSLSASVKSAVGGIEFGQTLAEQLQGQLDNLDMTPIARQIAAMNAQSAAEATDAQLKSLTDAIDKAQTELRAHFAEPFPDDPSGWTAVYAKRDELQAAITEAEGRLASFQRDQRSSQLDTVLEIQKTAIQARLSAEQDLASTRSAAADAQLAAQEAASSLYTAVASFQNVMISSVLEANQNLNNIAGQLGDSVGRFMDEALSAQLEALSHGKVAREVSAIDKQLREAGERHAREGARRSLADARRSVKEQTTAVGDARRALEALLSAGPGSSTSTSGQSTREQAYSRVVFPGEPGATTTTTSDQADFDRRVAAARRAVTDAERAQRDAKAAVVAQETALNELLLGQRRDRLRRQLDIERRHLTEVEAETKKSMQRRVADTVEAFNRGELGLGDFNRRIEKIIGGGVKVYRGIAKSLGLAVADEFWVQLKGLGFQAAAIADAPRIPGATGREQNIVRPLEQIHAQQHAIAVAQRARDEAVIELARKNNEAAAATARAAAVTAANTTKLVNRSTPRSGADPNAVVGSTRR